MSIQPEPYPRLVCGVGRPLPELSADRTGRFTFSARKLPKYHYQKWFPIGKIRAFLADRMRKIPESQIPALAQHLVNLSRYYQFDPAFILSVIEVESSFRHRAVSPAGAVGLMQLMPTTASLLLQDGRLPFRGSFLAQLRGSRVRDKQGRLALSHRWLMDPFVNLTLGIAYLASLRARYRGQPRFFLMTAYNQGPAKVEQLVSQNHLNWVKRNAYVDAVSRKLGELKRRVRESQFARRL